MLLFLDGHLALALFMLMSRWLLDAVGRDGARPTGRPGRDLQVLCLRGILRQVAVTLILFCIYN